MNTNTWIKDYLLMILLIIIACCTYGFSPLMTPDEGRYAELGREMLVNGQYIIPHINSIVYFEKPPLIYWLISLSLDWFGFSEWAARFWCVAFYGLTLFYTYFVIRLIYTRRLALYTVMVLASSLLYLMISHTLTMDFGVTFFINACLLTVWLCINRCFDNIKARRRLLLLTYILMGLAVMSKGLIGLIFPVVILGLWLLIHRRWKMMWMLQPIIGLVIVLLVSVPWLWLAEERYADFLHFYIWVQQFERYLTPIAHRSQGRVFYPLLVIFMIFPWVGFWVEMVAKVKWLWREYNFFMIWALVIIVFFAFSHSILIPYLLPASLPLAVLVAACFEQVADQPLSSRKVLYGVTLGVFIALFAAFIAILTVRHIAITPMIWDMVVLFGVAIIFSVVAYFKRMTYHSFFWVVMIIFMAALDFLFLETANLQQRSVKQLVLYVKAERAKDPAVRAYSFLEYYQDLPYYLQHNVYIVTNDLPPDELQYGYQLEHKQNPYVVLTPQFVKDWNNATPAYAFVKDEYFSQFQALFPSDSYCLLQKDYKVWLVGNFKCH